MAVAWLALQLASPSTRAYAVGVSLAAYSIPGAVVGLAVAGRLARFQPRRLLLADGVLRLTLLSGVPILHAAHELTLWAFVVLVACSSLFMSVGRGGYVALIADLVPAERRFAANTLVSTTEMITLGMVGPAIGGVLIVGIGAVWVIGVDALSFAALIWAAVGLPGVSAPTKSDGERRLSLRRLLHRPNIVWLLALTLIFYGLYGPFETALPLFVTTDLHSGPGLYGLLWGAFGLGAVVGGLWAGTLGEIRRRDTFALAVVAGWGIAAALVGATSVAAISAVGMLVGGAIYAPYPAVMTTTLQSSLPDNELAAGAVGWSSLENLVVPTTTALGGPLVAAIGARMTILTSGIATVGLAALVSGARLRRRETALQGADAAAVSPAKR